MGEEPACNAGDTGDMGSIPRLGRSFGGGHGNSLQCSCLENPTDRGAWWDTVQRVTESDMNEATEQSTAFIFRKQWNFIGLLKMMLTFVSI